MKIATVGRGTIGGGLAKLWRAAGHQVEELGRDGGDVSSADVVLVAVPGAMISPALSNVAGLEGKSRDRRDERPARAARRFLFLCPGGEIVHPRSRGQELQHEFRVAVRCGE